MAAEKRTENKIDPKLALRILRTAPITKSFLFFTDVGQYTAEFSSCLADFLEKLEKIPLKSIEFHFERGDFERWIRETFSDECLVDEMSKIDGTIRGEELRTAIQTIVEKRLEELKAAAMTEMHAYKKNFSVGNREVNR